MTDDRKRRETLSGSKRPPCPGFRRTLRPRDQAPLPGRGPRQSRREKGRERPLLQKLSSSQKFLFLAQAPRLVLCVAWRPPGISPAAEGSGPAVTLHPTAPGALPARLPGALQLGPQGTRHSPAETGGQKAPQNGLGAMPAGGSFLSWLLTPSSPSPSSSSLHLSPSPLTA